MRIAVLSDIHGNLPALRAVLADIDRWRPDRVILNGDLVNRGPNSRECLEMVRERVLGQGWLTVLGNHEEFVLHCADHPPAGSGVEDQFRRFTDWTLARLEESADWLREWPESMRLEGRAGSQIVVRHGSVRGTRDGIHHNMTERELRDRLPPAYELFLTAHTHRPFSRRFAGGLVVNSGSVGTPFDGDHRACYMRIEWYAQRWQAEPVRIAYDVEAARRNFSGTGFLEEAGPFAALFLAELDRARHLTRAWSRQHETAVREGRLGLDQSIFRFLSELDSPGKSA